VGSFSIGRRSRVAAAVGAALLAVAAFGIVAAPTASARSLDNHIYISYHGVPSFAWTLRLFKDDKEVWHDSQTCVGGCKPKLPWNPDDADYAHLRINTYMENYVVDIYPNLAGRDQCYLVKANGNVVYTGNELTGGCNGS
jgi:hypothetical protein